MDFSYNKGYALENLTWSDAFNAPDKLSFGMSNDYNYFTQAEPKFSAHEAFWQPSFAKGLDASIDTKFTSKPTSFYSYSVSSVECMSDQGDNDAKLVESADALASREKIELNNSDLESPQPCSSDVFPIQSKTADDEAFTQELELQNKLEVQIQINKDIDALIDSLISVPHYKDQRFSLRRDVVNKTILRVMKRFYLHLFKTKFPKLKLRSTTQQQYLVACEELLKSLGGYIATNSQLKFYLVQLVSNKDLDNLTIDSDLKKSVTLLNSCLYSYTDKRLKQAFQDTSSRLLFNYFFQHGQSFFSSQANVEKNLEEYLAAMEQMYSCFNGQSLD